MIKRSELFKNPIIKNPIHKAIKTKDNQVILIFNDDSHFVLVSNHNAKHTKIDEWKYVGDDNISWYSYTLRGENVSPSSNFKKFVRTNIKFIKVKTLRIQNFY